MPQHLLILGENASLRALLREQLEQNGVWTVQEGGLGTVPDAGASLSILIADQPLATFGTKDQPLLILAHPGIDLSGHEEADILPLPARMGTVLSALRTMLKRQERQQGQAVTIGPYNFHPTARHVEKADGETIRLTEKECAMLQFLLSAGGQPVNREQLLQEVWGYHSAATTHTLETHIYRLRQKIEVDAAQPHILVTEPSGYRLIS
jgi:DNA-binding winged helix-turn-helix (wHTH) protein